MTRIVAGMLLASVALLVNAGPGAVPSNHSLSTTVTEALPKLAGETTISATGPGFVDIRVPRAVKLDLVPTGKRELTDPQGPTRDIRLRGSGSFVGLLLTQMDATGRPQVRAFAGTFHPCPGDRCGGQSSVSWGSWGLGSKQGTLEPGKYRAFVLTDGSRGSVRIRTGDLEGTSRIDTSRPAPVQVASQSDSGSVPFTSVRTPGFALPKSGFSYTVAWVETADAGGVVGTCRYKGGASESDPYIGPGCAERGAYDSNEVPYAPSSSPESTTRYMVPYIDYGMTKGRFVDGCWFSGASLPRYIFCGSVTVGLSGS